MKPKKTTTLRRRRGSSNSSSSNSASSTVREGGVQRRPSRPVDREIKMREWLEAKLWNGEMPDHLWWVEKGRRFGVKWNHAARQAYNTEDAKLFKAWAVHSGKFKDGDEPDHRVWKANFRSALNSLQPDVKKVEEKKGINACRVYELSERQPDSCVRPKRAREESIKSEPSPEAPHNSVRADVLQDVPFDPDLFFKLEGKTRLSLNTHAEQQQRPQQEKQEEQQQQQQRQQQQLTDLLKNFRISIPVPVDINTANVKGLTDKPKKTINANLCSGGTLTIKKSATPVPLSLTSSTPSLPPKPTATVACLPATTPIPWTFTVTTAASTSTAKSSSSSILTTTTTSTTTTATTIAGASAASTTQRLPGFPAAFMRRSTSANNSMTPSSLTPAATTPVAAVKDRDEDDDDEQMMRPVAVMVKRVSSSSGDFGHPDPAGNQDQSYHPQVSGQALQCDLSLGEGVTYDLDIAATVDVSIGQEPFYTDVISSLLLSPVNSSDEVVNTEEGQYQFNDLQQM